MPGVAVDLNKGRILPKRITRSLSGELIEEPLHYAADQLCFLVALVILGVMASHRLRTRTGRAVAKVSAGPAFFRAKAWAACSAPLSLAAAIRSCSAESMSKGAMVAAQERRYEASSSSASGGAKSAS